MSSSETREWPVVVAWDAGSLDIKEPQERFKLSEWNYFIADGEDQVLVGYWQAEDGHEDLSGDDFNEIMHVIEGRLYVTCEGEDYTAGPGDTVIVRRGRSTRIAARERTRALFMCYPVADPEGYEVRVHKMMAEKGL